MGSWRWLEQKLIAANCCRIAKEIHKQLKINGLSLPSCPIWNNQAFMAGGKPVCNDSWQQKKIADLGQIIGCNGEMFSFNELKMKFGLRCIPVSSN